MFFPNTTVDVYRDSDETGGDEFAIETGPVVESPPLFTNVPVAVVETNQVRYSAVDLRGELVEQLTVRAAAKWGIREGDRLKDRRDGTFYQVQGVSIPRGIAASNGVRLVAKRVGTSG